MFPIFISYCVLCYLGILGIKVHNMLKNPNYDFFKKSNLWIMTIAPLLPVVLFLAFIYDVLYETGVID